MVTTRRPLCPASSTYRAQCCWAALVVALLSGCATKRPRVDVQSSRAAAPSNTPAVSLVREFVLAWRLAHRQAAVLGSPIRARTGSAGRSADTLLTLRLACFHGLDSGLDWQGGGFFNNRFPFALRERMYARRITRRSDAGYCPDWSSAVLSSPARPVLAQEAHFPGPLRTTLARRRAVLLSALEAVARSAPRDSVAVGQWVRFALDAGDTVQARIASAVCALSSAYCLRLRGLVFAANGHMAQADSLFTRAWTTDTVAGVCDVSAERQLATRGTARTEERVTDGAPPGGCITRLRWREQFWWASQPLWSEAYNARRVEHELREIEMTLRTQVASDELLDWSAPNRASAAELVTRYGWPDRLLVADSGFESSSRNVAFPRADVRARPVGAADYSRRRSATIPGATVLADPVSADPRDWLAPRANRGDPFLETWPYEHMWLSRALVPVSTWQWGRLWRAGQTVLCLATPVPERRGVGVTARLLFSPGPGDIRSLPNGVRDGATVRFIATLPDTAGVVSAELFDDTELEGPTAWRLRGGVRPLAGVQASWGDTVRVSDVLLVAATEAVARGTADEYAVANHLLPSTTLAAGTTRVGLVWELYGLRPSATVSYRLTVTGERPGGLRQLVSDLVSLSSGDGPTRIMSWERTGAQPGPLLQETLQLSGLSSGAYTVVLEARWGAGDADQIRSAPTTFEIR